MAIWKKTLLFYLGGFAYMTLEFLWRGRSHGSMFLAGGLCFLLIGMLPRMPLALRALLGALVITLVELGFGLTVNRDYAVWDYRSQPGNFLGQICPLFTLIWIPVAALATWMYEKLDRQLSNAECKMHNAK